MNTSVSLQIGIDWADQKHDYCLCPYSGSPSEATSRREFGVVASSPAKLHAWIARLRERFPVGIIEVCVELTRGQLINALKEYEFIRIFPLNPISSSRFRECLYPSATKDDVKDAGLLLSILQKHRDHLRELSIESANCRLLDGLVQARRTSVDQQTVLVQKLTSNLKEYYPQALGMIGDLSERMSRRFLKKWPSWEELKSVRAQTLRKFYYANQSRSEKCIQERLDLQRASRALCADTTTLELGLGDDLKVADGAGGVVRLKFVSDASHGKAWVDFDDALEPERFIAVAVDEGVDADRAMKSSGAKGGV